MPAREAEQPARTVDLLAGARIGGLPALGLTGTLNGTSVLLVGPVQRH